MLSVQNRTGAGMESTMKYLQLILIGLVMFVIPIMPSLVLCGLSLFYLKKHDWSSGFLSDRWGALGILSLILGVAAYAVIFLPTRL
jgi:hypothetical protein